MFTGYEVIEIPVNGTILESVWYHLLYLYIIFLAKMKNQTVCWKYLPFVTLLLCFVLLSYRDILGQQICIGKKSLETLLLATGINHCY